MVRARIQHPVAFSRSFCTRAEGYTLHKQFLVVLFCQAFVSLNLYDVDLLSPFLSTHCNKRDISKNSNALKLHTNKPLQEGSRYL